MWLTTIKQVTPWVWLGLVSVGAGVQGIAAADRQQQTVWFRDIHREGRAAIIGHFGLPIGRTVRLEGTRAKPSKVTNASSLEVTKVNGQDHPHPGKELSYPPYIQVYNAASLPEGEQIVIEGYEFLRWDGDPDRNWHVDVEFCVTKVIAPKQFDVQKALGGPCA
ncbi:MAG TPA: hypothetical protein VFO36_07320 [Nitrospiraceae bacterium]|nr:hypothetical protein [Nitrospiraceae bacterium]